MPNLSSSRAKRTTFDPQDSYTAYVCYSHSDYVEYSFWLEPSGNYWTMRKAQQGRQTKYYRYVNLEPDRAGLLERKEALE